jgi:hypothetical protein
MNSTLDLPKARFLQTLEIVAKEGKHLSYSLNGLFSQSINLDWVLGLELNPGCAEQLEAFISRFGRMQDTMADKLFPRWLLALAEVPGSQIETLNRAERLGIVSSTEHWLELRSLRNRLVHEYMTEPAKFVEDLALAKEYSLMLMETYNRLRQYALTRMGNKSENLPWELKIPESAKI